MNKELFSDKTPGTTVKGLGYQNKKKAEFTVKNMLNRDITYQFQVINTMYNRGLERIKRTKDNEKIKDLKEANIIFKKWLKDYKDKNRGEEMYHYLPLELVNKMEALADYYNISRKARGLEKPVKSDKGFLQIYMEIKGDIKKLRNYPVRKDLPEGQTLDRHRNNYCKRRLSMIKNMKKPLLFHDEGKLKGMPTILHTNMIMWGYSPEKNKIISISKKIKTLLKNIN